MVTYDQCLTSGTTNWRTMKMILKVLMITQDSFSSLLFFARSFVHWAFVSHSLPLLSWCLLICQPCLHSWMTIVYINLFHSSLPFLLAFWLDKLYYWIALGNTLCWPPWFKGGISVCYRCFHFQSARIPCDESYCFPQRWWPMRYWQ